jgi:hypothetical protein
MAHPIPPATYQNKWQMTARKQVTALGHVSEISLASSYKKESNCYPSQGNKIVIPGSSLQYGDAREEPSKDD